MSRAAELSETLQNLQIRPRGEKGVMLNPPASHVNPKVPASALSHPSPLMLDTPSNKAATVFPSHVRANCRRNPADRTGDLVRLLDDISTITHSISSYVTKRAQSSPWLEGSSIMNDNTLDPKVATHKLYTSLSHDGYACIILERNYESPLTFSDSALQGGYVVMLSALDVDPTATDHVLCGTIFSVYKRKSQVSLPGRLEDLQQDVKDQVAAGYVLYSSATLLWYTMGTGTFSFCLHPVATQYFLQPNRALTLPEQGRDLYTDYEDAKNDEQLGPAALAMCAKRGGKVYDNGCLIANFNGACTTGCLFLKYGMHLLCEAAPLAFVIEQMGGKATDGRGNRILAMAVQDEDVHKTTTFCAGPIDLVDAVETEGKRRA